MTGHSLVGALPNARVATRFCAFMAAATHFFRTCSITTATAAAARRLARPDPLCVLTEAQIRVATPRAFGSAPSSGRSSIFRSHIGRSIEKKSRICRAESLYRDPLSEATENASFVEGIFNP